MTGFHLFTPLRAAYQVGGFISQAVRSAFDL
jgi:hypothetical protein